MDPYDAIIEQLDEAREQGLRSLRERLEGILTDLDQVSSSIKDTLPEDSEELFPLREIPSSLAELRQAAAESAAVPAPVVTLELLRDLDAARSQSDLLRGLLEALGEHAARAVVLVLRPDGFQAWSAIGFDDATGLERWACATTESPLLADFVERPEPRRFQTSDDPVFGRWLESEVNPLEALLVPVSLRGKTMGAVYVDRLEDGPWDPEAVQLLVAISCWMIDTLKYRSVSSSPMLADIIGIVEQAGDAGDAGIEAFDADEEEVETVAPTEASSAASAALDEMASEPDFDPSATVQVEDDQPAAEPAGESEPESEPEARVEVVTDGSFAEDGFEAAGEQTEESEPEEPVLDETVQDDMPESETAVAEAVVDEEDDVELPMPPPVEPVVPPPDMDEADEVVDTSAEPLSAEDESRHEEARRFARLLVSEIKLYNEDAVDRGRQENDLYARLKDDIDRSREMYEKRIPPEIRTARDYFHEELVRILAAGEEGALGM